MSQMQKDPNNSRQRKANFTPGHDLALARCFIAISQTNDDLTSNMFWNRIREKFETQPEVRDHYIQRSSNSLKNRFSVVSQVAQKYIASEKLYRSKPKSGESEEDAKRNIMEYYKKTYKVRNAKGEYRDAPSIKFLEAVELLGTSPKFSMQIGNSSRIAAGYRYGEGASQSEPGVPSAGVVSSQAPSKNRPLGVKKSRRMVNKGNEKMKMMVELKEINDMYKVHMARSERLSIFRIKLQAVSQMDMNGTEKNRKFQAILEQLENSEQKDRQGRKENVRITDTRTNQSIEDGTSLTMNPLDLPSDSIESVRAEDNIYLDSDRESDADLRVGVGSEEASASRHHPMSLEFVAPSTQNSSNVPHADPINLEDDHSRVTHH